MKPYALKIDYQMSVPCAVVGRERPLFTWAVAAGEGEKCACARARVYRGEKEIWDSGRVSGEEMRIEYAGPALGPGDAARAVLTLTDGKGNETSAEGWFCQGYMEKWPAGWIRAQEDESWPVRDFYVDFRADGEVKEAALFFCGLGLSKAYINGEGVCTEPLNPAYSEYEKRAYYVAAPGAEKYIRPGENRLGVRLACGWRAEDNVCYQLSGRVAEYAGPAALTCALRMVMADGSEQWVCSDDTWKYTEDPAVSANLFMGEVYDAARLDDKWCLPGHETGGKAAAAMDAPCETLMVQTVPPVREKEIYPAQAVTPMEDGSWVVDFGQNLAGVCRLRLPSPMPTGTHIRIRHSEELDEDGKLFTDILRGAKAEDEYIAAGDGRDLKTWQCEFTYHGFRYAQVWGYPGALTAEDIEAVAIYTDVEKRTRFVCGSAVINRIEHMARQTEKSNIHGVLTDCPQRDERMGWLNDATVRFEATPYVFDVGTLFHKVVRDCLDVQGPEGGITCTAPFAFGNRPADPVCSSFLVAGWQAYLHTGNMEPMREGYPGFVRWNQCLADHAKDGIVDYSYYGDWASPSYACISPEHAVSAVTDGLLMSTGYHYYNSCLLAKMAEILGKHEDVKRHLERAEFVRGAFLRKWLDPETGRVDKGSQGEQTFALWLDILPEEVRGKAAGILHDDLVKSGYRLTTGNLTSRYILDVLTRYGYLEDAWRVATREEYPSLGYMAQHEATTVWERYELKKNPGMNSHNHPMYASAYYWYYASLAGLTPTGAGWRTFRAAPEAPKGLGYVTCTVETPLGEVGVRWCRRYGEIHMYLTVPYGAKAQVELPWRKGETIEAGHGFHHWWAKDQEA